MFDPVTEPMSPKKSHTESAIRLYLCSTLLSMRLVVVPYTLPFAKKIRKAPMGAKIGIRHKQRAAPMTENMRKNSGLRGRIRYTPLPPRKVHKLYTAKTSVGTVDFRRRLPKEGHVISVVENVKHDSRKKDAKHVAKERKGDLRICGNKCATRTYSPDYKVRELPLTGF